MKVVHLATTDLGGAYKATMRISESLKVCGADSQVLVRTRLGNSDTIEVMDSLVKKVQSKVRNGLNLLFSHGEIITDMFGADVAQNSIVKEADIIVLHWVNSFISAGSIIKIAELGKPIIWVMHDMWVFTGGCHVDKYCGKYEFGCGACSLMKSRNKYDRSYKNLRLKMRLFRGVDVTFVALSNWELVCAKKSMALAGKEIIKIANPIDSKNFCPMNRKELQKEMLNDNRKIILFGADKAMDENKGLLYLLEALEYLSKEEYYLVCFGEAPKKGRALFENAEILYLGTVAEERTLAKWYNIADVFVAPSMQESFGYTVCEALSCGTPVAAFAVGGIMDQIQHKVNGYLAKMRDAKDLAVGIEYCAQNRDKLTLNARQGVIQRNTYDMIGKKYLELFEGLLLKTI